jgi:hypothetical protein
MIRLIGMPWHAHEVTNKVAGAWKGRPPSATAERSALDRGSPGMPPLTGPFLFLIVRGGWFVVRGRAAVVEGDRAIGHYLAASLQSFHEHNCLSGASIRTVLGRYACRPRARDNGPTRASEAVAPRRRWGCHLQSTDRFLQEVIHART